MNNSKTSHVMVHDYAGHPFTVEFARALASKGWQVTYVYFAGDNGPKGRSLILPEDPKGFTIVPVKIDLEYSKSNFFRRRQGDIAYGKRLAALIDSLKPDIVLSGNTPTESQEYVVLACAVIDARFIYWCQDFYSIAAFRILSKKFPVLGHAIGAYYAFLERRQMRKASHVIHITDGFLRVTDRWGISRDRVSVIPNWGVINEIPVLPRENSWASRTGLSRSKRVIYSGTLATKHNPDFLLHLANSPDTDLDVIVVGFGVGADELAKKSAAAPNLRVLPLQPFGDFPQVLASADVLVAVIEADAGEFSVPSKVLSYMCASRPIVLAAPAENLAARIIRDTGAGLVVEPTDKKGFVKAVHAILADECAAQAMGRAGRAYAEVNFNLDHIIARFEKLLAPGL